LTACGSGGSRSAPGNSGNSNSTPPASDSEGNSNSSTATPAFNGYRTAESYTKGSVGRDNYMPEITNCQSCGMPFDESHCEFIAKEANGSDSIYCTYCYNDGAFLDPNATVEDVIEMGVPYLAHKVGEQAARAQLLQFVPTLARWNKE